MKLQDVQKVVHDAPHDLADFLHTLPDDHPLQIALRTYGLALSLALGPTLLSTVTSAKARAQGFERILQVVRRELGPTAFASSITVGIAGGAALRHLWEKWGSEKSPGAGEPKDVLSKVKVWLASLKSSHKTFLSNVISSAFAIALLQSGPKHAKSVQGGRPSPTLDLSFLVLVRAMDSLVQLALFKPSEASERDLPEVVKQKRRAASTKWSVRLDALVFWACCARIMWCYYYEPDRLPRSYNKWISKMADIDPRLLTAVRGIREGTYSYSKETTGPRDVVTGLARDLGYPPSWGDFTQLPAYGGPQANETWKALGVTNRNGVGGLPCEVIHGRTEGVSCTKNAAMRGAWAFAEAVAIYLPVHALPTLLTRPQKMLEVPRLIGILLSVARSATFLSAFVASNWFTVCCTRTLFLARLFPGIGHDFWDGPQGCTMAASLVCGASIWIERGRRRGEMALYVLPRAVRACLPVEWLKGGRTSVRWAERLAFILSLSTLLTAAIHRPDTLRGLSRWGLSFVMNGPNAGFWKRKRLDTNALPTPRATSPAEDAKDVQTDQ
ncbi:hypothetical protein C2E23DRAFT_838328 [Lenzites betulinus]|nr:hypothetical protein C2E23DRAFT_838328 [Lenzites betulinus]